LMFQRFPTHEGYKDPQLSNFYGMALPFLKLGVPVQIAHIENLQYPATLDDTKILLMTYSNMKPLHKAAHQYLADWVRDGGVLVYSGRDNDPFQTVREWWNTGGSNYPTASAHLFEQLGLNADPSEGKYEVGKGCVYVIRQDPKEYVLNKGGDQKLIQIVQHLYKEEAKAGKLVFKNNFCLTRGNYELISVLEESVSNKPYIAKGLFIDLFDPKLPVITKKVIKPGHQSMLFNIRTIKNKRRPQVLASAGRISNEVRKKRRYSFTVKSPIQTVNVMRVLLPKKPESCTISGTNGEKSWEWEARSKTVLIRFNNQPNGVQIQLKY